MIVATRRAGVKVKGLHMDGGYSVVVEKLLPSKTSADKIKMIG
jgi:hypothetical protein